MPERGWITLDELAERFLSDEVREAFAEVDLEVEGVRLELGIEEVRLGEFEVKGVRLNVSVHSLVLELLIPTIVIVTFVSVVLR